ncbi:MAG: hypothetical protein U0401_34365 [Anaerolineae bacterium]
MIDDQGNPLLFRRRRAGDSQGTFWASASTVEIAKRYIDYQAE